MDLETFFVHWQIASLITSLGPKFDHVMVDRLLSQNQDSRGMYSQLKPSVQGAINSYNELYDRGQKPQSQETLGREGSSCENPLEEDLRPQTQDPIGLKVLSQEDLHEDLSYQEPDQLEDAPSELELDDKWDRKRYVVM